MPSKPAVPKIGPPMAGDKGLAVKDGLREVRFNLRRGARMLVQAVEAATHHEPGARGLGLLGEPLNLAVRTTATLLSNVDHAAVDLLASDGPYRAMAVSLRASASYFGVPVEQPIDLRSFTTDHHWRYRHWLALTGRRDVFVHEQAIERAGAQVMAEAGQPGNVQIIQALAAQPVLTLPTLAHDVSSAEQAELAALRALGAVCTVLAGEIAPLLRGVDTRTQVATALRLADEVAQADRAGWERALHSAEPVPSMSRWLAFVLRHV